MIIIGNIQAHYALLTGQPPARFDLSVYLNGLGGVRAANHFSFCLQIWFRLSQTIQLIWSNAIYVTRIVKRSSYGCIGS
jgi:hypothetical protein